MTIELPRVYVTIKFWFREIGPKVNLIGNEQNLKIKYPT
jgi:hypothetical protein